MDRIQHSSATSTHQFTEGDPGNGIPATTVTAIHMNGVQNELVHIIEEAGITPDEAVHTQVLQALGELFQTKGSESTTPVLEALVSNAVSGVLAFDLGTRATSVVVVVKGNSSSALTLQLAGSVPTGSTVTVFNWNPGALTVTLASGTITGNAGTAALGDLVLLTKDTSVWWRAVLPTRGTVASLISTAVASEASLRSTADTTLQSNINSEASTRSSADASIQSQLSQLTLQAIRWATVEEYRDVLTQHAQTSEDQVFTIPVDSGRLYQLTGETFFTLGTGEPNGPRQVVVLIYDQSNTLLGKFATGKMAHVLPGDTALEQFGTFRWGMKIGTGNTALKVKVWGMVGTGGGATYKAQVTAFLQEVAG